MDRLVRLHRNPVVAVHPVADLNPAAEQVGGENPLLFLRLYIEFGAEHPDVAGESLDDERMLRVALDVEHRLACDLHPALSACEDRRILQRRSRIEPYGRTVGERHADPFPVGYEHAQRIIGSLAVEHFRSCEITYSGA